MTDRSMSELLYDRLANDEDARACDDISDAACQESPGSFVLILLANFFTKLGDAIASPKTVLAWATTAVGAPPWVLGFLVPIRESGALIPQIFVGGLIRGFAIRKWFWVGGSIVQALAIGGIGVVVFTLQGAAAGHALLALLVAFSLARGFCSVASKDVLGKTIPKPRRGRLTGWSASAAGLVTIGVGAALLLPQLRAAGTDAIGPMLIGAGALWILGAIVFALINEQPGATDGGRNAALLALQKLTLLRDDPAFGRFVAARALLMCSALSAPYFVALAQGGGAATALLGLFVIAGGLASLVSAPLWGRFADRSSRDVMTAAAVLTAAVGLTTSALAVWLPSLVTTAWSLPLAYFLLSVAHSGVRVGRKTYVVNLGSGNKRTDYVAVSNTVIGVLLLLVGLVGTLTAYIGNAGVIALLALMGLAGAALTRALPDVES